MMRRARMQFDWIDKVLLLVHSNEEPTDAEWDAFLSFYDAHIAELRGLIVYSPGPGPDTHRRRRIAEINEKRAAPIAVVTPSRVARGIVTALSWFGIKIKAFEPIQMAGALDYLQLQGPARGRVQHAYEVLYRGVFSPPADAASKA